MTHHGRSLLKLTAHDLGTTPRATTQLCCWAFAALLGALRQPQFPLSTYTGQGTLDGYVFYNLIDITIALPMPAAIKRKLI